METLFIGRNIIFLPEVGSTNSYAIDLLKSVNVIEGTVINTNSQTNGKGQRGASWSSETAKNLTVSIILRPFFLELKKQFFLYQISALACYDVMSEILNSGQFDIKIKWPNDIIVNKKKIAGILIENVVVADKIAACVVGVGLNINQVNFNEGLNATSVLKLLNKEMDVNDVLNLICTHLEKYYLILKAGREQDIINQYLLRLFAINACAEFEINDKRKYCLVKGINDEGRLILEENQGINQAYDVKEIRWIL